MQFAKSLLGGAVDLVARDRPDVWNIPARAAKSFDDRDDEDDEEPDRDDGPDQSPENNEQAADAGDGGEDRMHDACDDIENDPGRAEDDRLHGVKADKLIMLFEDVENDAAD